jgi:2-iminobutanoate/2-iminopropanoate deaminase
MSKAIYTTNAPAAIGPYSQAVQTGNMLFVSGQIPIDPATGAFAGEDIVTQTHQSLTNVKNILAAAGFGLNDVVKTTVLLADIADFAAMNGVYATFFTEQMPARVCYEVAKLPMGAMVEIDATVTR